MSKSENRRATKTISFRLTPDEHEQVTAMAVVNKIGVSTFARRAVFVSSSLHKPSYEQKIPTQNSIDLRHILGQIGKIGNNLNQLSKIANTEKSSPARKELKVLFSELRALRQDILNGVSK